MTALDELLDRLEELIGEAEALDEPLRSTVFELLDGVDTVHRVAMNRLGETLGPEGVAGLRAADPSIAWLFDAYAVGVDERTAADGALDAVRPYLHSHGGEAEVLDSRDGVVRLRLSGSCSGCTASAVTLQEQIEIALREGFPGFVRLDVEEDPDAETHPPPGPVKVEFTGRRG